MVNALSLTTEMEYDKADRMICIAQETGAGRISAGCTLDKKQEGYELVCPDGDVLVHNTCSKASKDNPNSTKPINRASGKKVSIDMEEVISGHTSIGQSQIKDVFPDRMNNAELKVFTTNIKFCDLGADSDLRF